MIGKVISQYKIVEELGQGGMGVVYRAHDMKLDRDVALKFLPPELTRDPEAKERFIQEARAASALDHPNICNIHEIDETAEGRLFISMAYYEGATLKEKIAGGALDAGEAIRIAMQVGQGLAKAHSHGIVHRDIKPANIMVTREGVAKILDFGLAKLAGQIRLTKTSSTLGTVAYMSPEQAGGKEIDRRADIWSLGVVLYEMLTGRLPFRGEYEQSMLYSIMSEAAAPLAAAGSSLPKELQRVMDRALAKRPEDRYEHVGEMLADLESCETKLAEAKPPRSRRRSRRPAMAISIAIAACAIAAAIVAWRTHLSAPREGPITSIAVLPFRNMSPDPAQEYFSDGMTEAIIKELSQIKALRVISLTSVMRYRNTEKMIPEIARELGVDAVVEGSVLRADPDVRITAQLIAARPEKHLWAADFTRTLENVLVLQSDVAQAIAREIRVTVTTNERERIASARVVNPEAHEAYLKGKYYLAKTWPTDWNRSLGYFQQAIDRDSTYALGYAGMAQAYDHLASTGLLPPREAFPKAKAYAEKALALDPTSAEGVLIIADAKYCYDWDLEGAEEYFRRALELDPNLALAHLWYGGYLESRGRFEGGLAEYKRAMQLDPFSVAVAAAISHGFELAGEYDSALVYADRIAEIDSSASLGYMNKASIAIRRGDYKEAIAVASEGASRDIYPCVVALTVAYALDGQTAKAREVLAKFLEERRGDGYHAAPPYAIMYCALRDRDKTIEYLEKAYEDRNAFMITSRTWHPYWDFIKSDPRYIEIMKKVEAAQ